MTGRDLSYNIMLALDTGNMGRNLRALRGDMRLLIPELDVINVVVDLRCIQPSHNAARNTDKT
jgi:hypothetical protein